MLLAFYQLFKLNSQLLPHLVHERVHSSINNTGAYTSPVCEQNENFLQPLACTSSPFATLAAHPEGEILHLTCALQNTK